MVVLLLLITNSDPLDLMHKIFKVLANATYVQPTRGGRFPRIHATTPPSINIEPGGSELGVPIYMPTLHDFTFKNY